ncbi:hypothetical protein HPE56_11760 [Maribacter sp. ANRC-HE7]|uniref:Uncharacterized protein n=1 Tax=Maribacter aquimaris TaxID=2737171 RepID=A0ABR7V5L3_9FLAO|nr:hypothetical protein [Maribacter aquimaris]MBD0778472.1 hypothetical protein [Maribacter aquimaris]
MKKPILLLTILFLLLPKHNHAQDNGAVVAGAVGALAAIGVGVAAVGQMKESGIKMQWFNTQTLKNILNQCLT